MSEPAPGGSDALALIASAIGEEAAHLLAKHFGGTRLSIPRTIDAEHRIAIAIGAAHAARLAEFYGGSSLDVPKRAHRQARVRELHRAGTLTIAAIALETGYSERQVYRLLSAGIENRPAIAEKPVNQLDLFEENRAA